MRHACSTGFLIASLCLALYSPALAGPAPLAPESSAPPPASAPLVLASQAIDEMPSGMRLAYIRGIREELMDHGYDGGPEVDTVGPRLVRAVRHYQRDAGLPVDGVLSKELLDHLKFAIPLVERQADFGPDPDYADRHRLAIAVQTELQARGYYRYKVDGIVGPITRAAIRAFQSDAGLPVDGELDPDLLVAMREDYPYVRAN
jgi:peptidoglycan hydrolase-like protein with peptidoglycan-binding domain